MEADDANIRLARDGPHRCKQHFPVPRASTFQSTKVSGSSHYFASLVYSLIHGVTRHCRGNCSGLQGPVWRNSGAPAGQKLEKYWLFETIFAVKSHISYFSLAM